MENMYQKMQELAPDKDPIFTAVSRLTNSDEMKAFVKDCTEVYRKEGLSESVVKENIGFVIGYCDKETANKWMNTVEGVSHPIFGKDLLSFLKD